MNVARRNMTDLSWCCLYHLFGLLQQELLVTPNYGSVLGRDAYNVWKSQGQAEYDRRVKLQTRTYAEYEEGSEA
jgi:ubiquitin-protein ligase